MRKITLLLALISILLGACYPGPGGQLTCMGTMCYQQYFGRSIRPSDVEHDVVKYKTTRAEIKHLYGQPALEGVTREGQKYWVYSRSTQTMCFYFNGNDEVADWSTNPPR